MGYYFVKNGPTTASFSFIVGIFKPTLQFLQQMMSIQYTARAGCYLTISLRQYPSYVLQYEFENWNVKTSF